MRPTAHEGLDICYYSDGLGVERWLDCTTGIPAMASGAVLALCDDFLGRSIFVHHYPDRFKSLISVYAHILPHSRITPGYAVAAGEVIGTVADTTGRKNRIPAHLHITILQAPLVLTDISCNWDFICSSGREVLIDPFSVLACPHLKLLSRRSD